jgi:nicotinate-nucleotide adenylyltransferase
LVKRGILGGTFDPPHAGHLLLAKAACRELGLDEVIFIPAGEPWVKAALKVSPAADRLEMVRLAVAGLTCFQVSDLEVKRPGPSYTWETLEALKREYPGDELWFILGWDNLAALPGWHRADRIVANARLAAAPREGFARPDLKKLEEVIPGIGEAAVIMEGPRVEISASEIRRRLRRGEATDELLPPAVADYVKAAGLYR